MQGFTGKVSLGRFQARLAIRFAMAVLALAGARAVSAQGTITNLSPSSIPAGSAQFNLSVTVSNLPSGSHSVYWDGNLLTTLDVNATQVQAVVTPDLLAVPGTAQIVVVTISNVTYQSSPATFTISGPTITALQPGSTTVGHPAFTLTLIGTAFVLIDDMYPTVNFGAGSSSSLPVTYIDNTQLQVTVPSSLVATAGTVPVTVSTADGSVSAPFPFIVGSSLSITTKSLPAGTALSPYDVVIQTANGVSPLVFTAGGLPAGLSINSATGEISGTPANSGTFTVSVTVTDSTNQTATAQYTLTIAALQRIPLQFTTTQLPGGQVGVAYSATISITGGFMPYTISQTGGSIPPGLSFGGNIVSGTPTTVGTSKFTVQVQDAAGTTISQDFTIVIAPPPLSIVNGALSNAPAGTPLSIVFTATGGYPGYTFSADSAIPTGMTFSANGTLAGTPTVMGTFRFTITVKDSAGTSASKSFNLTVVAPLLAIVTASLPSGQMGAAYSVQFYGVNGQQPYTWTASGAPAGLAMSATGSFSGTPTVDGAFTVTVTVTDTANNQAKGTYSLTIAAAPLVIATANLPSGTAGVAYSTSLAASGGDSPYSFTVQGLPSGIVAAAGALSGTPASPGSFTVTVTVTDSKGVTAIKTFTLTVAPAALAIATAALPAGTVGAAYSTSLAATGGAGSNQWAATGLPAGLTLSAGGTVSGTPTAPGTSIVVATVTDSAGTKAVQTFTLIVGLPATPPLTFGSLPGTANPGTQSGVQVGLGSGYPLPVTVTLTLTFAPDSGADDPNIQFSTGGRMLVTQIPAGSTALVSPGALQMGTVAGTITITARLSAAGQDITPSPAPTWTIRIAPGAPSISSVTAIRTASGFTVTAIGFATTRQVTQVSFQFTATAGANLQTGSLTLAVSSLFAAWYTSSAAAPYGSQFSFVQPFTVTGDTAGITSVIVTLTNAQGNSTSVTAAVQ